MRSEGDCVSIFEQILSHFPSEVIDGSNVRDAADDVMLDVAQSPVLVEPINEHLLMREVPKPCHVVLCDAGRRAVTNPRSGGLEYVSEQTLKEMRARYLLTRGWYYRRLSEIPHSIRQEVISRFFPGGVVVPRFHVRGEQNK